MGRTVEFCTVHWMAAAPSDYFAGGLLAPNELDRMSRMRNAEDRIRFVCATVLAKQVIGSELGADPASIVIDRQCRHCDRDHGRPIAPDPDLFVSLTHRGELAGVAITRAGPVGLDVEPTAGRELLELRSAVLGTGEVAETSTELLRYWTRKEALVKATGDGIGVGLTGVLVSAPSKPPTMASYRGRAGLDVRMTDLASRSGYLASVAVLTANEVRFKERWHRGR